MADALWVSLGESRFLHQDLTYAADSEGILHLWWSHRVSRRRFSALTVITNYNLTPVG